MKQLAGVLFAVCAVCLCQGQSSLPAPIVTMGITLPILNQPASIQVLVTNPQFSPSPTGNVTVDFGDGSNPAQLTLSELRVETTHTYTTLGQFTVTASYGGDANFAPANKALTTVSVVSAPVYRLTAFGDSLTGGQVTNWPALLTGALGWTSKLYSCGGCKTQDQAPSIYSTVVDASTASTWLLGQNDAPITTEQLNQFSHAALAENAWLAIPEGAAKLRAQNSAVTQSGAWTASDLYTTTGLRSTAGGSSLTATMYGSTIYVGLSDTESTDYTVDVLIDGVDQGTVSPVEVYTGEYESYETYGLRYAVGGSASVAHTVQIACTDPGTSGCYVDWIGGNGAAALPNLPPYVWTGVSYRPLSAGTNTEVDDRSNVVREVEGQLESDGLAIRLADIESLFSGVALTDCSGDGTHPSTCGNQIEETVWLSAMDFLATEAQRIDIGAAPSAVVGTPLALDVATATSGRPVTYTVISGPGTLNGNELTAQQPGTIVIQADQAGNATALPAAPVQFSVVAQTATETTLASSDSTVYAGTPITLTATVTAGGSPLSAGTVSFNDGSSVLGTGSLNANGAATLTVTLPVGTHSLTAAFAQTVSLPASTSAPVTVTVQPLPPDFTLSETPGSLSVKRGGSGMVTVELTPVNGFDAAVTLSCSGLPVSTTCAFAGPVVQADGTWTYTATVAASETLASNCRHAAQGTGLGMPLLAAAPLGLLLLLRRRRAASRWIVALAATLALAGLSACTASRNVEPVTGTVTITAQAASGQTHSTPFTLTVN